MFNTFNMVYRISKLIYIINLVDVRFNLLGNPSEPIIVQQRDCLRLSPAAYISLSSYSNSTPQTVQFTGKNIVLGKLLDTCLIYI